MAVPEVTVMVCPAIWSSPIHECNGCDDDPFALLSFSAMAMIARRTYSRFQPDFMAASMRLSMEGSNAKRQAVR
ncbi:MULTISPECIES: hypothetical protein [unclassified Rhizobium]|uniref:hypothetical protein n=1 Tax=unclassified Rhizobium TaxID=2613769 RepID=UPI0006462904|nr:MULTISPECIES: hypothetical protein [unclassified Rhizobium]MBN8952086.1 hypothetical protein [Rhizobium tropici]OJY77969.1 MAG: hypothetical protein BGP09_12965 [Rhizobium sp. 60-20]